MDSVATSTTPFQKGHRSVAPRSSDYSLRIKACYLSSRFIPDGPEIGPMRLAWNPGGSDCSISYESSRGKVQYDFNIAEAAGVEVKCYFILFFVRLTFCSSIPHNEKRRMPMTACL